MRRLSKKEIRAEIEAMKTKNDKPLIQKSTNESDNEQVRLTPKHSSQRIRKQGSN